MKQYCSLPAFLAEIGIGSDSTIPSDVNGTMEVCGTVVKLKSTNLTTADYGKQILMCLRLDAAISH